MNDTISRKAAIEALLEKGQSSRRYKIGEIWELNFDEIREALATVPSTKPRWISVFERLPKYSDSVLVSTCDYEIDIGSYFSNMWHINGCGPVEDDVILAWMPLPEPYGR